MMIRTSFSCVKGGAGVSVYIHVSVFAGISVPLASSSCCKYLQRGFLWTPPEGSPSIAISSDLCSSEQTRKCTESISGRAEMLIWLVLLVLVTLELLSALRFLMIAGLKLSLRETVEHHLWQRHDTDSGPLVLLQQLNGGSAQGPV